VTTDGSSGAALIGPERELEVLSAVLADGQRGRYVLLLGEPGMGKTTLLAGRQRLQLSAAASWRAFTSHRTENSPRSASCP